MAQICLCMIVRNEHSTLERCLTSVRDAVDDIVIVDTGSTDDTREIAARFTPHVYDYAWHDDFAAARNYSFAKASGDYIMWLDADDVLSDEARAQLSAFKSELDIRKPDVVMMKYCLAFDSAGNCTVWNYRERLLKRSAGFRWVGAVHEVIAPSGLIERSEISIEHRPNAKPISDRNLKIYEGMLAAGKPFTSRDLYYYARELYGHRRYEDAAQRFEEFLNRPDGWIEDRYAACLLLGECHAGMGDERGELAAYYRALEQGEIRAAVCCALGRWYVTRKFYHAAEFWFRAALACPRARNGFINEDDHSFTPYIWLCVCRDRLGDPVRANAFNELARAIKPDHPSVLYNVEYFRKKLGNASA